ncbi:MAG: large subunit ribosomal protein L22 [Parcubacteria group bacterium Gr01-1014_72]|nr:MAG: large subunit ribosomal protein L22 [Parcubacteria group bacterium Gr01-1014_72]
MKAFLKNYRQSPRKLRLVARAIAGKSVSDALAILSVTTKAAVVPLRKLLASGIRNAENNDHALRDNLFVKELRVDAGPTLKRMTPRARGSGAAIRSGCAASSSVPLRLSADRNSFASSSRRRGRVSSSGGAARVR